MDAPTVRRPWVLGLTGIAFFMVGLDALVVNNALPTIHRDLGGILSDLEWIFNAYLIAFAVDIIPAAAVADRIGRRRLYVVDPDGLEALDSFLAELWPAGLRRLKEAVESDHAR